MGELGSLKDKLNALRKEAKQLARARAQPHHPYPNYEPVYDERLGEHSFTEIAVGRCNTENVFMDEPVPVDVRPNVTNINELYLSRISADTVLAHGQEPMRDSSPARLSAPQVPDLSEAMGCTGKDVSQHKTGLLANLPGPSRDHVVSGSTGSWMNNLKFRQDIYEEQLQRLQDNMISMSVAVQNAETSYRVLHEDVESLKSNSSEVWQRLKTDELRLNNLDGIISRVENKMAENLETVQEWFVDLTAESSTEIPREIINSIQDVINDSSPGLAVDRMRDELREIRDSLSTSHYVTEGLRGLVVDLSDQVSNSSLSQLVPEENLMCRDNPNTEISKRECKVVRKGMQRTEKHLRQLILNNIHVEPVDISLIKKYKTVDVPCVYSAIGSIQKSLQRYVKFSGMDSVYCDVINELLDDAENWCLKVEELYYKAEIHSINTSKGDTADVGVFSDNAKVSVYEFLEAAEIAYLGWGNSVQKANRVYNRHL